MEFMKKALIYSLAWSMGAGAWALDPAVEDVQAVCALANGGKSSEITVDSAGEGNSNGLLRLIGTGIKGEVWITQEQYEGLQAVLANDRARDYESYRNCVKEALPYFKKPVAPLHRNPKQPDPPARPNTPRPIRPSP